MHRLRQLVGQRLDRVQRLGRFIDAGDGGVTALKGVARLVGRVADEFGDFLDAFRQLLHVGRALAHGFALCD